MIRSTSPTLRLPVPPALTTLSLMAPLLLFLRTVSVDAFPEFRDRIPNGQKVPNPTIPGSVWAGVGHENVGGGGARNPFGLDFAKAGYQWTKELCEMDSDGDGRTNGEELGDPDCEWEKADSGEEQTPPTYTAQSHPGVPDDVPKEPPRDYSNTCADYDPPSDTVPFDVTFTIPNVLDGSVRTEYICDQFELSPPDNSTLYYHMIKSEVLLRNGIDTIGNDKDEMNTLLHHISIYICLGVDSSDGNEVGQGPYSCNGVESNCDLYAGWALGMPPLCEPSHVGYGVEFRADAQGLPKNTVFKVEAHYDNPLGITHTDQSGMRLHLTKELRPLKGGVVVVGMDFWDRQFPLESGKQTRVERTNLCPSAATQLALKDRPVWVYSWNPHMHIYGRALKTEHYRCGEKIGEIGNIVKYEFDNQQSYILDPPIKILPGDSLVTTCYYNTSDAPGNVLGGEEATDEMCENYLSYYPSVWTEEEPHMFNYCVTYKQGLSTNFVDDDNTYPYAVLDMEGDIWLEGFPFDSSDNFGECCYGAGGASSCEELYLSRVGEPCGVDSDCNGELAVCYGGLCQPMFTHDDLQPTPMSTVSTSTEDDSNGFALFNETSEVPCAVDSDCTGESICGAGLCLVASPEIDAETPQTGENELIETFPINDEADDGFTLVTSEANDNDLQKATTKPTEPTDDNDDKEASTSSLTMMSLHILPYFSSCITLAYICL